MSDKIIIAFSGKKQSGKDTAAKIFTQNYGFTKVSFAEPLKKHLYTLNPWIKSDDGFTTIRYQAAIDVLGDDVAKETYKEIRRLQQIYGISL